MTSNPTNPNSEVRHEVHLAMLAKSDSAKDLGELTVVPLGFAVTVAMELVASERQRLLDAMKQILSDNGIDKILPLPKMNKHTEDNYSPCLINRALLTRYINVVNALTALREEKL